MRSTLHHPPTGTQRNRRRSREAPPPTLPSPSLRRRPTLQRTSPPPLPCSRHLPALHPTPTTRRCTTCCSPTTIRGTLLSLYRRRRLSLRSCSRHRTPPPVHHWLAITQPLLQRLQPRLCSSSSRTSNTSSSSSSSCHSRINSSCHTAKQLLPVPSTRMQPQPFTRQSTRSLSLPLPHLAFTSLSLPQLQRPLSSHPLPPLRLHPLRQQPHSLSPSRVLSRAIQRAQLSQSQRFRPSEEAYQRSSASDLQPSTQPTD